MGYFKEDDLQTFMEHGKRVVTHAQVQAGGDLWVTVNTIRDGAEISVRCHDCDANYLSAIVTMKNTHANLAAVLYRLPEYAEIARKLWAGHALKSRHDGDPYVERNPCAAEENGMEPCNAGHLKRGVACGSCLERATTRNPGYTTCPHCRQPARTPAQFELDTGRRWNVTDPDVLKEHSDSCSWAGEVRAALAGKVTR